MEFAEALVAVSLAVATVAGGPQAAPHHPARVTMEAKHVGGARTWIRGGTVPTGRKDDDDTVVALSIGVREDDGRPVDRGQLSQRLTSGTDLGRLAAPFAAAVVSRGGQVTVAADHAGLRQVYGVQGDGWAAVSSSALELARVSGAGLDTDALGDYRLTGHHLGTATPFTGVVKLPAGHAWRLSGGRLATLAYPQPAPEIDCPVEEIPLRHADRLRQLVSGFLDHYPEAVLELSGGLDSRMVLAAIPPARRAGLAALTLTSPGSADGPIAAGLARRYGLRHQTIDVSRVAAIEPARAYLDARAAAVRTDALGAPLSVAVFEWAESQVEPAPRLGGHGGELARGAYYLQRQHPRVEPELVDQLARWWIISNNAVGDEALDPAFAEASRLHLRDHLRQIFNGYDTDWLTATDEFYLRERLHRWAGVTLTAAATHRVVANPLLDPLVLALIRAVPRPRRSGSRYAAGVLDLLDPQLARLPLASGLRPIALSRRFTVSRQLGENTVRGFAVKAADKVGRRLLSRGRPATGAAALGQLVAAHWRANPHLLDPVRATGLIRPRWLDGFLAGGNPITPATVDFLLNLEVAATGGRG